VTAQKYSIWELLVVIYTLFRIIVGRSAKTKHLIFQASSKIMTLIRLIQRASILAGMTFAILPVYGNPAQADTPQFCVIASNGKTACGTLKAVERACVTTDAGGVVCGKFKSAREEGQEESRNPAPIASYRKEVDNFVLTLESCKRVDEDVRCQMKIFNKGKKRSMSLSPYGSSIVDAAGRSHAGSKTDFGQGSTGSSTAIMDTKTDIIISVTFDKVPAQVVKAQLFNLSFGGEMKPIQLRNVPISN
jgi:hypothetical protein